jgi:hypothetical protein
LCRKRPGAELLLATMSSRKRFKAWSQQASSECDAVGAFSKQVGGVAWIGSAERTIGKGERR